MMTSKASGGNAPRNGSARRKKAPPEIEIEDVKGRAPLRQTVGPIEVSVGDEISERSTVKAPRKVRSQRNAVAPRKSRPPEEKVIEKRGPSRAMIASIILFFLAEFALIDLEWSHRMFKLWDPRFVLLPLVVALPLLACRYFSSELRRYQDGKVNQVLMREIDTIFSTALIPSYFYLLYVCSCALWHWCRELAVFLSNVCGAGQ
jgi:hypothetical protein